MTERTPTFPRFTSRRSAGFAALTGLVLAAGCMAGNEPGIELAGSGLTQNSLSANISFSSART